MTDITKRRTGKTGQARQLRQNETEAEYRLWSDLRNRLLNGHKFARQVPLGAYIADFVCRERRLIVELDGSQHAESTSDTTRTAWLNDQGYDVLRFWNGEVLSQKRDVLETILAVLDGRITESCETSRFYPAKRGWHERASGPSATPSSGSSSHLLPAGEKRECAAPFA